MTNSIKTASLHAGKYLSRIQIPTKPKPKSGSLERQMFEPVFFFITRTESRSLTGQMFDPILYDGRAGSESVTGQFRSCMTDELNPDPKQDKCLIRSLMTQEVDLNP